MLHGMNNALRYFPFDHEFGIRHSSVSVQIHVFETFTHFIFFIRNEAHFSYDLKDNYSLLYQIRSRFGLAQTLSNLQFSRVHSFTP